MVGADENSAKDMSEAVAGADAIREATGAHVCLVHHAGKEDAKGMRGSSALLGAADTVIQITADKGSGGKVAEIEKQKEDDAGRQIAFKLESVELGEVDEDGDQIRSAVVALDDQGGDQSMRALPAAVRAYIQAFKKVVAEHGERFRTLAYEPEVMAADREKIRREFHADWPANGETEAQRAGAKKKAFQRAESAALKRKLVATKERGARTVVWELGAKRPAGAHIAEEEFEDERQPEG